MILVPILSESLEIFQVNPDPIIQSLVVLARDKELAPYVLVISSLIYKEPSFQRSGILRTLKNFESQINKGELSAKFPNV